MKAALVSFASGLLFALGLGVAGMTQPKKVMDFLDFTGGWDPSLMLVMVGAIGVNALAYHLVAKKRSAPLLGGPWHLPHKSDLDRSLLLGSALFGVGWGLGGYCPGPGVVSTLGTGWLQAAVFVATMLVGMAAYGWLSSPKPATTPVDEE